MLDNAGVHRRELAAEAVPLFPAPRQLGLTGELAPLAVHRRNRLALLVLMDALALILGSAAAIVTSDVVGMGELLYWVAGFDVLAFLALTRRGLYRTGMAISLLDEVARLLRVTASAGAAIIVFRVTLAPAPDVAAESVRLWAFVTAFLVVGRIAFALELRRHRSDGGALPTLIVGAGNVGALVGARLLADRQFGLLPVGFLDDEPFPDHAARLALPLLGRIDDLERAASAHNVAHVVVCFSAVTHEVLLDVVRRARQARLGVSIVPRLFEEVTRRLAVSHLGGIPLLQVDQPDPRGWGFSMKYALDRVVAGVTLACLAPFMLVVAAMVKVSSPGPIFYRQRRVGLDGRHFEIFKFRTMLDTPEAAEDPGENVAQAMLRRESPLVSGDRRTPIGRWLRRLSLDELPQIINVVKGEMSLVGPRPERPSLAENFERQIYRYGERHRVKSGMTGWAQVHGLRGQSSLSDRAEWDNYYIENWSPWLDLKILLLTVPAMLRGDNDR